MASNQLGIRNSGLEVFSKEKPFRVVSCGFVDCFFRISGIRGTEGIEVALEVTKARVETSPYGV